MNVDELSVPDLSAKVQSRLDKGQLVLSRSDKVLRCSKEETAVWAVCDGLSTLGQLAKRLEDLPGLEFRSKGFGFICGLYTRMREQGWMTIHQRAPIVYPVALHEYDQFVACRNGLYAVNKESYQRLAYGMFFGICLDLNGDLLAYEFPHLSSSLWRLPFSDAKKADTQEGLVRRFRIKDGYCAAPEVAYSGLPNNCHYLVFDQLALCAVDTSGQSVFELDQNQHTRHSLPFKQAGDCHINSLKKVNDTWLLMRSISSNGDIDSGILVLDENWQRIKEFDLPAQRAHDIYCPLEGGADKMEFWYCDSANGHIAHYPSGKRMAVDSPFLSNNTTRGFSESGDCWVVGSGIFGRYYMRYTEMAFRGMVSYVNKDTGEVEAEIRVPEAPCCILRISC